MNVRTRRFVRLFGAAAAVAIASLAISPAFATTIPARENRFYQGSECQPVDSVTTADIGYNQYGAYNKNTSLSRTVICPIVTTGSYWDMSISGVTYNRDPGAGLIQLTSFCAVNWDGSQTCTTVVPAPVVGGNTYYFQINDPDPLGYKEYAYLSVQLPPQTAAGTSHIVTFQTTQ